MTVRETWINKEDEVPLARQCVLAGICRATIYRRQKPKEVGDKDLLLCQLIDEEYTKHPFYGSRRMAVCFRKAGHSVNRKRVQRLMRLMGLVGMAPGPNTSRPHPEHKVYPYLLRGIPVVRPNQVWSTDITYIRLARGFVYLVAILDWYSRRVLSWRISNSMDATFCVDCLEEALRTHGKSRKFSTATKDPSSPAMPSPACWNGKALPSVWMDGAGPSTTSSSSASGAMSNTRTCI